MQASSIFLVFVFFERGSWVTFTKNLVDVILAQDLPPVVRQYLAHPQERFMLGKNCGDQLHRLSFSRTGPDKWVISNGRFDTQKEKRKRCSKFEFIIINLFSFFLFSFCQIAFLFPF